MTVLLRRAWPALLLLSVFVLPVAAQDEQVRVVGSGVAAQAFTAVAGNDAFETEFSGTQNGLGVLCGNAADVALTNRPISQAEESACTANGVNFIELLVGFDGFALIASPDVDFVTCLAIANLDAVIAPSLAGSELNWTVVNGANPETPIEFVHPGAFSRPGALLDRVVRGDGFRSDATELADSAAVFADVAAGAGKIGVVSLAEALSAEGVNLIALNNPTLNTCVEPSAETAFSRQYTGGDRLFAYVNEASLEKPGIADALAALVDSSAGAVLAAEGFVPPSDDLHEQAVAVVNNASTGRSFSRDVNTFQVTGDTTGTLRVAGDAASVNYLKAALATVPQRYPTITLEEHYLGGPAAVREFCNGNRELVAVSRPFTEDELAACEASEIETYEIAIGAQAAVIIANGESDYLSCISTSLIAEVFATGEERASTWNSYDDEFPDDPVFLFVSSKGDTGVDLMLSAATGATTPVRDDVQVSDDPDYRAAAVANTPGALAVMTWPEAQAALEDHGGIQLVAVSEGEAECVEPAPETIADGSYPLAAPVTLIVNAARLETDMLQATLMTLFADENFAQIETAGLTGLSFSDLVGVRAELIDAFRAADQAQAEREAAGPEATPEVTDPDTAATAEPATAESETDVPPANEATPDASATAAP
jgi:phosphate transport system substrate-binding protein